MFDETLNFFQEIPPAHRTEVALLMLADRHRVARLFLVPGDQHEGNSLQDDAAGIRRP